MEQFKHYAETAHHLAQLASSASDQIEAERRIPDHIIDKIIDEGFFRLLLPKSLGGAEMDHPSFLKIVRIFAEADASTAWCINQNNVFSTNAVRVCKETAEDIWGDPRTVVTNGPPTPDSKAVMDDDAYVLSGRWNFSSGICHANWVAALAPVYKNENSNNSKPVEMRVFLLPINEVKLLDEWHVGGLRGTGSLGFEASEVSIHSTRSYRPSDPSRESGALYLIDTTPMFASGFATVALGTARAGLDIAIEVCKRKVQQGGEDVLRMDATTQRMIGEAEAIWNSARTFLHEATCQMWESVSERREFPTKDRIKVRLASTHAIRKSADIIDIAYTLCGSSAIFAANPIQRKFQDIHAITQQIQGRLSHYDTAGQFYLGLEPKGIF